MNGFGKDCSKDKNGRIDLIVFICTIVFVCVGLFLYLRYVSAPSDFYLRGGVPDPLDGVWSSGDIAVTVIKQSALSFAASVLLVITAIMLVWMGILLCMQNLWQKCLEFFYAGMVALIVGVWFFADIPALRFVVGDPAIPHIIAYVSMIFVPVPLLLHLKNKIPYEQNTVRILCTLSCIAFAGCLFVCFSGFVMMQNALFVNYLFFCVCIILITALYARGFWVQKNCGTRSTLIGVLLLSVSAAVGLFFFYFDRDDIFLLPLKVGLTLFTFIECTEFIKTVVHFQKIKEDAATYKMLAYRDNMTGLVNRTGFDMALGSVGKARGKKLFVCVLVFDLDNLKGINDTYGHAAGDRLIRSFTDCLKQVFANKDMRFRIGGDEFAVIITSTGKVHGNIERCIKKLDALTAAHSVEGGVAVEFSWGYAIGKAGGNAHVDMSRLFIEADNVMYEQKRRKLHETEGS